MPKLTKEYIAERRSGIHTYESFGRALIERICDLAEERIGDKSVEMLEIDDVTIQVRPFLERPEFNCIKVYVIFEPTGKPILKHVTREPLFALNNH